ncbi:hypothetical protein KHP62_19280 [Rhodobacteraceae bacterium NNCM2]|nr:hypothetical protein [Coraliihabitans acroporae]
MRRSAKQIFIHIGAQKTASAMLRRTLAGMECDLQREGVRLVKRHEVGEAAYFGHIHKISRGRLTRESPVQDAVDKALEKVLEGPEGKVLMTSEHLFSKLELDSFFQNIDECLHFLQHRWIGHDLKIILYVRSQEAYVTSCYAQFISLGRSFSFDDFIGQKVPRHLDWYKVCENIAGVIGRENLMVRPYESIRDLGPVAYFEDFLRFVGVDSSLAERAAEVSSSGARSNRGLSAPAIEVARHANGILEREDREKLRKFLQNNMSTSTHPKAIFWSDEQLAEMDRIYGASNRVLFERYMPAFDGARYGYPGLRDRALGEEESRGLVEAM